ncbi:MAG: PPC domain-containing protein [Planctomycetaceae bacterium]|nr:PPC domain-containing protein [Planctomycetaceae bacterium]
MAAPPAITRLSPPAIQRGTTATLDLQGALGDRPVSIWCSRPELTLELAEDKPQLTVTASGDVTPGLCWIRLHNAEGATEPLPLLVGVLPQIAEVEPNNLPREAQRIETLPSAIQGVLHKSGEVDVYAVELQAGDRLTASVAANSAFGSPMDPVLQLLSADGFVLDQNDDTHGNDPQLSATIDRAGIYYLRLFAFPIGSQQHDQLRWRSGLSVSTHAHHTTAGGDAGPFGDGWHRRTADRRRVDGVSTGHARLASVSTNVCR